jgi:hypothetical protein
MRKLWQLHGLTAGLRATTILTATRWLEHEYRHVPYGNVALAIAIHYLLLAMRGEDTNDESSSVENHLLRPGRCREEARRWIETASGSAPRAGAR